MKISSCRNSERDRANLKPYLEVVQLKAGEKLAELEEPLQYVWFPHGCVTSTVVATDEGTYLEVGLMGAEGMVGLSLLFGEDVSNTSVIVQVPGEATRMPAKDFKSKVVAEGGSLFQLVQKYCNAFMAMLAQSAVCNVTHPIEERMARWLLMTHDRVKSDEFPLSHKFLSMMLGVRRSVVAATANVLKTAGAIDYTRDSIKIVDRASLEELSCECYDIITRQLQNALNQEFRGELR